MQRGAPSSCAMLNRDPRRLPQSALPHAGRLQSAMHKKPGKTRFICTIGPKILDAECLRRLHASGMNIARVNGSHGSLDDVRNMVQVLQQDLPEGVEILLDLPGNKIRTDNISEPIELEGGQKFVLKPENLTYRALFSRLQPGCRISAADGAIQLEVTGLTARTSRPGSWSAGNWRPARASTFVGSTTRSRSISSATSRC